MGWKYLSMLRLKLNHVSKRGPEYPINPGQTLNYLTSSSPATVKVVYEDILPVTEHIEYGVGLLLHAAYYIFIYKQWSTLLSACLIGYTYRQFTIICCRHFRFTMILFIVLRIKCFDCQANIWTNAGLLLTGLSGTNFREILSEI